MGTSCPKNCYTMAMCAQAGHEDVMLSFCDITPDHIIRLAHKVRELKGTVPGLGQVQ
jgi:hypothetical protein